MTTSVRVGTALILLLLLVAPGVAAADPNPTVSVDRATVRTTLGQRFVFRTTLTNHTASPATGLVAHLNILSLDGHVYVDPEDWSSHRTRYLPPIPANGSTTLTWKLNAVNAGHLGAYVAVLPRSGATTPPTTGPTVSITVADRRTLNSGGILPLAVGIPALLGLLVLALKLSRAHRVPSAL
jgi:hypothetical protein